MPKIAVSPTPAMFRPKSGHGATGRGTVAGQHPLFSPVSNPSHTNLIQRLKFNHTPSSFLFAKVPLAYLNIEPAIHGVKTKRHFAVSKAYSGLVNRKIRF